MSLETVPDHVERAAKAIYREFIRHGAGTRRFVRDAAGGLMEESLEQAVERRWWDLPPLIRHRFRTEAVSALESAA